ncbi:integrase-type DNA-binding superfamily protein [Actinidia rufa]|uniref:Integrase-type DNA-binding superfamily protein n=1 Tax=Actinidia rufa TaxID=165716 RepID=A0A7J0FE55_9ERIC|nr:integrase-type DNA-binding superfamily protein [Actinidia rufa]
MTSPSSESALKAEIGGGETSEGAVAATDQISLYRGVKKAKRERGCTAKERISKMPPCAAGKRSSIYRGVTRHRWTGRYEAHLWDKSTWNQNQNKKGKQGAYDDEEAAARAYDLAALKYWGPGTLINFPVTDYTRDLEEMQNVSREEYLASLRRAVASQEESPNIADFLGILVTPGIMVKMQPLKVNMLAVFVLIEKIDLTAYIKWWGSGKSRQSDSLTKSSDETKHGHSDDIGSELKTLEWAIQPTEPYQMPRLGTLQERKNRKGSTLSALSILSRSAAYKNLQERAAKKQEKSIENDENENKCMISKMDYGKAVEKLSHDVRSEELEVALSVSGGLPLQRNMYPLGPFLSAPLLTDSYNTIDPLSDPILWTTLVPVLPPGLSRSAEVGIISVNEVCIALRTSKIK